MRISVIMIRGILWELQACGVALEPLLASCGIAREALEDVRLAVSPDAYQALVRHALDVTRNPALGLSVGLRAPETVLPVVGPLMVASRTLREAVTLFRRYAPLFSAGARWSLIEQQGRATFTYAPAFQLGEATRFTNEFVMAAAWRVGRHFAVRPDWPAPEVCFQHALPPYAARYEAAFRCPIRFRRPTNAIAFPAHILDRHQLHADDAVRATLGATADQLLREHEGVTAVERVRALLCDRRDLREVDAAFVATTLGLTPRALRRQLSDEGASLSRLLNEARLRVACEDLKRTDSCIKELSERLGFSEPSAFHRAFKRWTGRTPGQWARG